MAEASNCTQICPGQGAALSPGAVALSGALPGGRQAGAFQQPRETQHKALCHGAEELLVLQYAGRGPEQRSPVQSDWNGQGDWSGSLPLLMLGSEAYSQIGANSR